MFNKEFLKTLTILYVEDDVGVREVFGAMLSKIFKDVILCTDGLEGLEQFKLRHKTHKKINAIISDINMPRMNGLDMLKEIRKLDYDIPVILTTAYKDSELLMKAIEFNASYYALKPISTPILLENIQKFCMMRHNYDLIIQKEKKLSTYIKIIGQVATIAKIDQNNHFIEVNKLFCEMLLYNENEIIGKHIKDITHGDILATVYVSMNEAIQQGENWEGRYKYIDKDGNSIYFKIFAIPEYDDDLEQMNSCVFVGFIATEDEKDKRNTMQKVRQNILEQRKKISDLKSKIRKLENSLKQQEAIQGGLIDVDFLKESLEKYKNQNAKLTIQITRYENDINMLKKKLASTSEIESTRRRDYLERNEALQNSNTQLQEKLINLQNKLAKLEKAKDKKG
jgi:PAS domain S-box-containing protein